MQCRNLEERLSELRRMVERNGGKVADFDKHAALKDLEYKVATGRTTINKLKEQVGAARAQVSFVVGCLSMVSDRTNAIVCRCVVSFQPDFPSPCLRSQEKAKSSRWNRRWWTKFGGLSKLGAFLRRHRAGIPNSSQISSGSSLGKPNRLSMPSLFTSIPRHPCPESLPGSVTRLP